MRSRSLLFFCLLAGLGLTVFGIIFILSSSPKQTQYSPPSSSTTLPSAPDPRPGIALSQNVGVVASIFPLADFVSRIGGDKVVVGAPVMGPAGRYNYEPTPNQIADIARSRMLVRNGLGLEGWLDRVAGSLANPNLTVVDTSVGIAVLVDGQMVAVEPEAPVQVTKGRLPNGVKWELLEGGQVIMIDDGPFSVEALEFSEGLCFVGKACQNWPEIKKQLGWMKKKTTPGAPALEEKRNPYIWLDPVRAQVQVNNIYKALLVIDPDNKDYYRKNLEAYLSELISLDAETREVVRSFTTKAFVASNRAWSYFARRYGLNEAAVIEEAPGKEASTTRIKEVIDVVRKLGVRAVFADPQLGAKSVEAVAKEAGIKAVFLDPLGGVSTSDRNSYINLMRYNVQQMALGMK